jgi:hypothetical protein
MLTSELARHSQKVGQFDAAAQNIGNIVDTFRCTPSLRSSIDCAVQRNIDADVGCFAHARSGSVLPDEFVPRVLDWRGDHSGRFRVLLLLGRVDSTTRQRGANVTSDCLSTGADRWAVRNSARRFHNRHRARLELLRTLSPAKIVILIQFNPYRSFSSIT